VHVVTGTGTYVIKPLNALTTAPGDKRAAVVQHTDQYVDSDTTDWTKVLPPIWVEFRDALGVDQSLAWPEYAGNTEGIMLTWGHQYGDVLLDLDFGAPDAARSLADVTLKPGQSFVVDQFSGGVKVGTVTFADVVVASDKSSASFSVTYAQTSPGSGLGGAIDVFYEGSQPYPATKYATYPSSTARFVEQRLCLANYSVVEHMCVPCPAGTHNPTRHDVTETDTECVPLVSSAAVAPAPAALGLPAGWDLSLCAAEMHGDGICDCGCGGADPDCAGPSPEIIAHIGPHCDAPSPASCDAGVCAHAPPSSSLVNAGNASIPASNVAGVSFYDVSGLSDEQHAALFPSANVAITDQALEAVIVEAETQDVGGSAAAAAGLPRPGSSAAAAAAVAAASPDAVSAAAVSVAAAAGAVSAAADGAVAATAAVSVAAAARRAVVRAGVFGGRLRRRDAPVPRRAGVAQRVFGSAEHVDFVAVVLRLVRRVRLQRRLARPRLQRQRRARVLAGAVRLPGGGLEPVQVHTGSVRRASPRRRRLERVRVRREKRAGRLHVPGHRRRGGGERQRVVVRLAGRRERERFGWE
jgi:hypothetical protein